MNLGDLREIICGVLQTEIAELKTCEPHGGRFNIDELKRVCAKAPAVFVSMLSAGRVNADNGGTNAVINFAVYVVTKRTSRVSEDQLVLNLVQKLIQILARQQWGLDESEKEPENIKAQNLFSQKVDRQGVAMWGITFSQQFDLGGQIDLNALADFNEYVAEHVLADGQEPAAIDKQQMEQD